MRWVGGSVNRVGVADIESCLEQLIKSLEQDKKQPSQSLNLNRPSARDSFAYYFPIHQHHQSSSTILSILKGKKCLAHYIIAVIQILAFFNKILPVFLAIWVRAILIAGGIYLPDHSRLSRGWCWVGGWVSPAHQITQIWSTLLTHNPFSSQLDQMSDKI